jgi:photosystem II stability/assembly factor-like uncharacterized protein
VQPKINFSNILNLTTMKILSAFLIFCVLLFTNCKEATTPPEEVTNIIKAAPFENSDFKIERATINLPEAVTKIHFFDEMNGICLTGGSIYGAGQSQIEHSPSMSAGGSIYTTNDRGLTWTLNYTFSKETSNCLRPLGFEVLSNQTIVAFAGASVCPSTDDAVRTNLIIRSTDKGKNWSVETVRNTNLRGMVVSPDNVLYAIGQDKMGTVINFMNTFLSSRDGGLTWDRSVLKIPFLPLGKLVALSSKKLYILSDYCNLDNFRYESPDKGANWQFTKGGTQYILGVSLNDKVSYYLGNTNGKNIFNIYQTTDNGDNWTNIRTVTSTTNEVKAISATSALILGKGSGNFPSFSYTLDAGKTWKDMEILDNLDAGQMITSSFYTPKNGYIVASKKVLYKMTLKK